MTCGLGKVCCVAKGIWAWSRQAPGSTEHPRMVQVPYIGGHRLPLSSAEPEGLLAPSSPRPSPLMPESLENDSAEGAEGEVEPEAEALGSANSEPGTPRAGRPAARAGGSSRAERCAGVHISDPYNVNLPLHITSILSVPPNIISNVSLARLTRGLECPALQPRPSAASGPGPGPGPPGEDPGIAQDWGW